MKQFTTKLLVFVFLSTTISLISCNKDDDNADPCGTNWNFSNEIQDELDLVIATAAEYGQNPSMTNCVSYKAAYQDYLDAVRGLENCARLAGQLSDFNAAINEAETALNNIQC